MRLYLPCPEVGRALGCRRCLGTTRSGRLEHDLVVLDLSPLLANLIAVISLAAAEQRGASRAAGAEVSGG